MSDQRQHDGTWKRSTPALCSSPASPSHLAHPHRPTCVDIIQQHEKTKYLFT